MTIAELNRFVESWKRNYTRQEKERAAHNYILAGLVGKCVASYFSNNIEMPKIEEVYSNLFEEKVEETKNEKENLTTDASVARFMQFVNFHNKKFNKVVENLNDE